MGTMAAVITDPLKARPKYKAARQVTKGIKEDKKEIIAEQGRDAYKAQLRTARQNQQSIKNKWKDPRSNKVEYDTKYMWDKVQEILSAGSKFNTMYDLLHLSNTAANNALGDVSAIAEKIANNQEMLQQDAMRMSMLLGAPLPEEGARGVVVGDNRFNVKPGDRGRRSLRIDTVPPSLVI